MKNRLMLAAVTGIGILGGFGTAFAFPANLFQKQVVDTVLAAPCRECCVQCNGWTACGCAVQTDCGSCCCSWEGCC